MHPTSQPLRRTLVPAAVAAVLSLAVPSASGAERGDAPAPDAAQPSAPEAPAGLREAYARLSEAIVAEDLPALMKLFDMEFLFEALDGSSLDRGPWRRLWEDRFEASDHVQALFEVQAVLEADGSRAAVRTRVVRVFGPAGSSAERLRELIVEDTWTLGDEGDGDWRLVAEKEAALLTDGDLLPGEAVPESPRLAALVADPAKTSERVAELWKDLGSSAPLVEAVPGDEGLRLVTFLWRDRGRDESVTLRGGALAPDGSKRLQRLGATDLWYRTERLPADARLTYDFAVVATVKAPAAGGDAPVFRVGSVELDPLNPRRVDGRSAVELPDAPLPPWAGAPLEAEGPEGSLDRQVIDSVPLGERRVLTVYTPPGLASLDPPPVLAVLLDEGTYESRRATRAALDGLIAGRKIQPVVAVLVHGEGSKRPGLELSGGFVKFVAEEVVPLARKAYRVAPESDRCLVGGTGLGGALAAWCALERPDLFRGVILHSATLDACPAGEPGAQGAEGAPRGCGWLARQFARTPRRHLQLHLEVGTLDPPEVRWAGRGLRDVLEAREYPLAYREYSGSGSSVTWLESLARGLDDLLAE